MVKSLAEKIFKYKDFTVEIQRMWNSKTKVIQVIRACSINSNHRTAALFYRHHTKMVCFRYIIVNTLREDRVTKMMIMIIVKTM